MRLLDRYLLREFLVPLGFCLAGFLIFWIAFDLFNSLHLMQDNHLRGGDIAEYYLFKIPGPEFLPMALPMALLLALLYALTNHSRHNEITAIRAAGLSLGRLSMPYLAVGLAASVSLFALSEFCAPKTEEIAEQILNRRIQRRLTPEERQQIKNPPLVINSREHRYWHIGVYNLVTGEMIKPHVDWDLPDGSTWTIDADHALRKKGVWTFSGHVQEHRKEGGTDSLPVKLAPVDSLAVPEFSESPDEIRSQISVHARFGHQTKTKRADVPIQEIWNYRRLFPNPEPSISSWLGTKLQGRFAGPCTCLVVILIGVPFAAGSGRRSVFVGVAASISIFFAYFILQQLGLAMGEAGRLSPWIAAWLPNLAFGLTGLILMARVR